MILRGPPFMRKDLSMRPVRRRLAAVSTTIALAACYDWSVHAGSGASVDAGLPDAPISPVDGDVPDESSVPPTDAAPDRPAPPSCAALLHRVDDTADASKICAFGAAGQCLTKTTDPCGCPVSVTYPDSGATRAF